jgi:DNA end-binding protein Ku
MAVRPYWKGQLRLALVSIPVEIYKATKSGAKISFRQIHEPSGQPIKYEKVVPGIGPIDPDEIVKGYEVSKNTFVLLDEEEIEAVKLESKRNIDLVEFVDSSDIDVFYFDEPYYVVPADELAEEAYIVLRDALRETGKVGIGQLAIRGQEFLVSLKPCGRGLVLETLHYADEVNRAQNFFRDIEDTAPDPDLLDLAKTLIEKKAGKFDASAYHNRYIEALHRLIEKKQKAGGKRVLEDVGGPAAASGRNIIDLMAALKASVEGGKAGGRKAANVESDPKDRRSAASSKTALKIVQAPTKRAGRGAAQH